MRQKTPTNIENAETLTNFKRIEDRRILRQYITEFEFDQERDWDHHLKVRKGSPGLGATTRETEWKRQKLGHKHRV